MQAPAVNAVDVAVTPRLGEQEERTGPLEKDPLYDVLQEDRLQQVLKRYRLEHLDYQQVKALHRALGEALEQ